MLKLKFLILIIYFIQVVSNVIDFFFENDYNSPGDKLCSNSMPDKVKQCVKGNSFLSNEDIGSKCCLYSYKLDPLFIYKKAFGENWKKIIALGQGFDLNISEEEIRKKFSKNAKESNECQYTRKGSNITALYLFSMFSINGKVIYDYGEGKKIFNRSKYHPKSKEEIIDKELIDAYILSLSEKDCLKRGTKLSDENYKLCWCEKIPLSPGNGFDERSCIAYRNRNFKERLIIEMNEENKSNSKYEKKCICSNNKNKITKGRYNSVIKKVKVE